MSYIQSILERLNQSSETAIHEFNDLIKEFELPKEIKYKLLLNLSAFYEAKDDQEKNEMVNGTIKHLQGLLGNALKPSEKPISVQKERKLVLECRDINKEYPSGTGFRLENLNVKLYEGEITAVVGENGNGKSTICKIIAGLLLQDSGTLHVPLFEQGDEHDWLALKQKITYLPQELHRTNGSVEENLFFEGRVSGIPTSSIDAVVSFYIQRLDLHAYHKAIWDELSGGYRLRFKLALC